MQYLWNLPGSCAVCLACPHKVGIFIQAKLRMSKICDPFHWTIRKDGFILDGKTPQQVVTCFQWRCCLCRMRCLYTQLLGSRLSRSQLRKKPQILKDIVLLIQSQNWSILQPWCWMWVPSSYQTKRHVWSLQRLPGCCFGCEVYPVFTALLAPFALGEPLSAVAWPFCSGNLPNHLLEPGKILGGSLDNTYTYIYMYINIPYIILYLKLYKLCCFVNMR